LEVVLSNADNLLLMAETMRCKLAVSRPCYARGMRWGGERKLMLQTK
jgi:hypothetical protein